MNRKRALSRPVIIGTVAAVGLAPVAALPAATAAPAAQIVAADPPVGSLTVRITGNSYNKPVKVTIKGVRGAAQGFRIAQSVRTQDTTITDLPFGTYKVKLRARSPKKTWTKKTTVDAARAGKVAVKYPVAAGSGGEVSPSPGNTSRAS